MVFGVECGVPNIFGGLGVQKLEDGIVIIFLEGRVAKKFEGGMAKIYFRGVGGQIFLEDRMEKKSEG